MMWHRTAVAAVSSRSGGARASGRRSRTVCVVDVVADIGKVFAR